MEGIVYHNTPHWVPVSDSVNEWLQIGECGEQCPERCASHNHDILPGLRVSARLGEPQWAAGGRGTVYCCGGDTCSAFGRAAGPGHTVATASAKECQDRCRSTGGCKVCEFRVGAPLGSCLLSGKVVPIQPPSAGETVVSSGPRCGPELLWHCSLSTKTATRSPTVTQALGPEDRAAPLEVIPPDQRISRIELELTNVPADTTIGPISLFLDGVIQVLDGKHATVIALEEPTPGRVVLLFDVVGASQSEKAHLVSLIKQGVKPFDILPLVRVLVCYESVPCDGSLIGGGKGEVESPAEKDGGDEKSPVGGASLLPLYICAPIVAVGILLLFVCWSRQRSAAGAVLPVLGMSQAPPPTLAHSPHSERQHSSMGMSLHRPSGSLQPDVPRQESSQGQGGREESFFRETRFGDAGDDGGSQSCELAATNGSANRLAVPQPAELFSPDSVPASEPEVPISPAVGGGEDKEGKRRRKKKRVRSHDTGASGPHELEISPTASSRGESPKTTPQKRRRSRKRGSVSPREGVGSKKGSKESRGSKRRSSKEGHRSSKDQKPIEVEASGTSATPLTG
eukprot:Hpha_TRINITY_DN13957_c0_g2::TRINITY_DN13957_c0_g2_i2::g.35338::m.35338